MSERRGLLENGAVLLLAVSFFLAEGIWSWLSVRDRMARVHSVNMFGLLEIFGLAFAIFIGAGIAYRSRFWGDRLVFGTFAGALAVSAVMEMVPLAPRAVLGANVAQSILWTAPAVASLVVLARRLRTVPRKPS